MTPYQFIFTRVEPEYSPAHLAGYQMAYHSPGIPAMLLKDCEDHVKSYHPPTPGFVRRQFFSVENSVILTRSIQVETIREINDRDGRPKIFLCHGLIFKREDFTAATGNNPFLVFDQFNFVNDSRMMVQNYDGKNRTEPAFESVFKPVIPSENGWLKNSPLLVDLACQAAQRKTQGQFLEFIGSDEEIAGALRIIFYLTPPQERLACSFDTSVDQLRSASGIYWAAGVPEYQSGTTLLVNCRSRRLDGYQPTEPPKGSYLAWLTKHAGMDPETILVQVPTIQEIGCAFQEKRRISFKITSETGCLSFWEQFKPAVVQRLQSVFSETLFNQLAGPLVEYLLQNSPGTGYLLNVAATGKFPEDDYARLVRSWLQGQAPKFPILNVGEWEKLANFASRENDPVLQFWASIPLKDEKARLRALQSMDDKAYEDALELIFNPFNPLKYLHPAHIQRWIAILRDAQETYTNDDFLSLVTLAIEAGGAPWLDDWANRISIVDNKTLTRLEKQVEKAADLSSGFYAAMQQRRKQLGRPVGLLNDLKELLHVPSESRKKTDTNHPTPTKDKHL